ncbi:MAG: putative sensor domain DACNV-containing protein [Rubrobacteraceae bacterium]
MNKDHAYPRDLAAFVLERWPEAAPALPDYAVFEELLSTCYQAGLMREEERPVNFRLILAEPEIFPLEAGPPIGYHRLEFITPVPLDEDGLRRLSPAIDYSRSLVGVRSNGEGGFEIWGAVHSGPRWIRSVVGGRGQHPPLPPVPVVHVTAPGRLHVHRGDVLAAGLEGGRLSGSSMDIFDSNWLSESFAPVKDELASLNEEARVRAGKDWAPLEPNLTRTIAQHTVRRIISVMRNARHGGTIVFVPTEVVEELSVENRYVAFKHTFPEGESRRRFRTLISGVTNRLAKIHGKGGASSYPKAVGWAEYQKSRDPLIEELDEAIFEVAHLIANLSKVDGAVVMTKRFEVLGFGVEISGALPAVETVARTLDLEGERTLKEPTDGVGTRHRSAYRLCGALPGAVAVVVSQDGSTRFVTRKDGEVAYWDQV